MALQIPGIDRIQKENPRLGEALKKIQDYTNINIAPVPGNKVPRPPINIPGISR